MVTGKTPVAVPAPRPARLLRPVLVPASLDELHGPASGMLELPQRLCWSLDNPVFDLGDADDAASAYTYVLDAARTAADLVDWLDAGILARVWGIIGMGQAKREAWESACPLLREAGRAAA
jgi:hypothetical protein